MTAIRVGKCPMCAVRYETDLGRGCSEHRERVREANKEKMAALREKKEGNHEPRT
jgi:hypothetical protein